MPLCTERGDGTRARRWNDANVVALGLRLTSPTVAAEVLEAFLTTEPDAARRKLIARVG